MASDRIWRDSKTRIVLDSSAVLMLFEQSINLDNELKRLVVKYQIIVPKQVVDELKILSENSRGKKKINAKTALKLIKEFNILYEEYEDADNAVIITAKKYNGIILSNDKEIRKKAKKEKINTIYLKGKNHLIIEKPVI